MKNGGEGEVHRCASWSTKGCIYLHMGAELDACRDIVSWLLHSSCYKLLDLVLVCADAQWRKKTKERSKIEHELQLSAASGELFQLPKVG